MKIFDESFRISLNEQEIVTRENTKILACENSSDVFVFNFLKKYRGRSVIFIVFNFDHLYNK